MRFERDHLIFKALVALDEVAERAGDGPIVPNFSLRFTLAFLFAVSNGDRTPYDGFWKACQDPQASSYSCESPSYIRATTSRTQWNGICRTLGVRQTIEFMSAIAAARRSPERKQRQEMAAAVRAAGARQRDENEARIAANSCSIDRPNRKR